MCYCGVDRGTGLARNTQTSVSVNTGAQTSVVIYAGLWANGDTWLQVDDVTAT